MEDVVLLEWGFTPSDYFEDEIRIIRDDYEMVIKEGKVEARISPSVYDHEHKMRDSLHENLNNRFLGVQLLTHKSYDLSKASMCRLHPDGRRDVTLFIDSLVHTQSVDTVDLVVKDKEGNIISNSHRDRFEKKKKISELAEIYCPKDPVAAFLLKSYDAAVNDPENELVHLFDIWEALRTRFKGENAAQTALGISDSERSKLGRLANNDPLRQGRHRGTKVGELRDATETELEEARGIVRNMIEAYLHYLESQDTPKL